MTFSLSPTFAESDAYFKILEHEYSINQNKQ